MSFDLLPERLRKKIVVDPASGCWIWTGAKYGKAPHLYGPHRRVYEMLIGKIGDGLEIDHLCEVKLCCNPEHLEPVTPLINQHRSKNYNASKTHCPYGHELIGANVKIDRRGYRRCQECNRTQAWRWRRKMGMIPRVHSYQPVSAV